MPTPAADLRQGVADLSTIASGDLAALWRQVGSAVEARQALQDVLPALIETYGAAAATLAADWYDDLRDKTGIGGRFRAIPAALDDPGGDILARWAVAPLFAAEPDWHRARVLVEGGLQLRIANASRYTVAGSAYQDPRAVGWQRVGDGSTCGFCSMLIGRGAVYTDKTARFGAHDHCGCQAAPAFKGEPLPVEPYRPTSRTITDADRARTREWVRANT